jgi:hypothetical protein
MPCQKQLIPQPAELYRAASTRIVMSNGSSEFMIAIPNSLLPLQAGLDTTFNEGVCDKVRIRYDGSKLKYKTETTCDWPEGLSAELKISPDLSTLESASGRRFVSAIVFNRTTSRFNCGQ